MSSFNWVDIVIVTFLVFSVFQAFKEGFVSTLIGLFGYIAAFIGAKMYYKEFSTYLETNYGWYAETKLRIQADMIKSFQSGALQSPGKVTVEHAGGFTLPMNMDHQFGKMFESLSGTALVTHQAELVSSMMMEAMSFLMLFIGLVLLFQLLGLVLNVLAALPGLKLLNRMGGGLLGLIRGVMVIYALMAALVFLSPIASKFGIIQAINSSTVGGFFYNYNVVIYLLGMVLK